MTILFSSHLNGYTIGFVQTDATTPTIDMPIMVGVAACVLAVVCKRMQQLPTMLGPAVHRGKDTTHKFFYYIDTSVLLENIPLVKFIKTTSGIRVVYFP